LLIDVALAVLSRESGAIVCHLPEMSKGDGAFLMTGWWGEGDDLIYLDGDTMPFERVIPFNPCSNHSTGEVEPG
jgi:hypothetical protein